MNIQVTLSQSITDDIKGTISNILAPYGDVAYSVNHERPFHDIDCHIFVVKQGLGDQVMGNKRLVEYWYSVDVRNNITIFFYHYRTKASPDIDTFIQENGIDARICSTQKIIYNTIRDDLFQQTGKEIPMTTTVQDIMHKDPLCLSKGTQTLFALGKMDELGSGRMPIKGERGELIGVISETHILPYLPFEFAEPHLRFNAMGHLPERLNTVYTAGRRHDPDNEEEVVYLKEDDDISTACHYMCDPPRDKPRDPTHQNNIIHIHLLPVVNSDDDMIIKGVVTWADILKHWEKFPRAETIGKKTAIKTAKALREGLVAPQGQTTVDAALYLIHQIPDRYLLVADSSGPTALFSGRDLMPYRPLIQGAEVGNWQEHFIMFQQVNAPISPQVKQYIDKDQGIDGVYPRFSLDEVTIEPDLPIWSPDPQTDSVVKTFMDNVLDGKGNKIPHRDRKEVLLVRDDKAPGKARLITPFDCIDLLWRSP